VGFNHRDVDPNSIPQAPELAGGLGTAVVFSSMLFLLEDYSQLGRQYVFSRECLPETLPLQFLISLSAVGGVPIASKAANPDQLWPLQQVVPKQAPAQTPC